MSIALIVVGGVVIISLVRSALTHFGEKRIELLKYQKEILELETEKEKTRLKLLEEENKKLDKIIFEGK